MLTNMNIIIILLSVFSVVLINKLFFQTEIFDKYFLISLEETYNLDDLFSIKIKGQINPKVDFLEIPYQNLEIIINTKTIRGTIVDNRISLEFIKLSDRKKIMHLIKKHYTKAVKPYIQETIKLKREHIELIKISKKEKHQIKKIACQTCKHRMQCQITFNECNYERKTIDEVLNKGITVDTNKNYELDSLIS